MPEHHGKVANAFMSSSQDALENTGSALPPEFPLVKHGFVQA
jgi:hypothetical protein